MRPAPASSTAEWQCGVVDERTRSSAIVVAGSTWDEQAAREFDLVAVPLAGVTMFHIDYY